MIISIINDSGLNKENVQRVIRAVNRQLAEDFRLYWHKDVQLRLEGWTGEQPDPEFPMDARGDAVIYLMDETARKKALGYHSSSRSGVPYGFVFTNVAEPEKWSVTLSHEALELAVDPEVNLVAAGPHPDPKENGRMVYHWYELCDAVQGSSYKIDDVEVANFVLPLYFTTREEQQNHNDFLGTRIKSFGVGAGGYIGYVDPDSGADAYYFGPEKREAEGPGARESLAAKQAQGRVARPGRRVDAIKTEPREWMKWAECDAITFKLTKSLPEAELAALVLGALGDGWNVQSVPGVELEYDAVPAEQSTLAFAPAWAKSHALAACEGIDYAEPSLSCPVPGASDSTDESPKRALLGFGERDLPGTEFASWGLKLCNVQKAWAFLAKKGHKPGEGVLVGHPDSGYRPHKELDSSKVRSDIDFDFLNSDSQTSTRHGNHGLSTASVILSAPRGEGDHIVGPATHAKLLPLRVTKARGLLPAPVLFSAGARRLRAAIDHATRQNCGVISMSLGTPFSNSALKAAINRARNNGLIVLAAAGNIVRLVTYPARWDDVIAVAGCNIKREAWSGSCRGDSVDITAPGESVWRAYCSKGGREKLGRSSGTSYAVALTAGVAAMWVAYHGHRKLVERYGPRGVQDVFLNLMQATATKVPKLPDGFGSGILDADALMRADLPGIAPKHGGRVRGSIDLATASAGASARMAQLSPAQRAELEAAEGLQRCAAALRQQPLGEHVEAVADDLRAGLSTELREAL